MSDDNNQAAAQAAQHAAAAAHHAALCAQHAAQAAQLAAQACGSSPCSPQQQQQYGGYGQGYPQPHAMTVPTLW